MKYRNKKVEGLREVLCVIPHKTGDIGFKFQAISDEAEFDKLSPAPKAPLVKDVKAGVTRPNVEDKGFLRALDEWGTRRTNWMFLQSMSATEDMEWETISLTDPTTWGNWQTELKDAGFSTVDIRRLLNAFTDAQSLDQAMLEEARKRFLTGVPAVVDEPSLSPTDDKQNSQSGESVSDSESGLPA